MEDIEIMEANCEQNKYNAYQEDYEICRKKSDAITLLSDRVSILRGITFAVAGLLLTYLVSAEKFSLTYTCLWDRICFSYADFLSQQTGRRTGAPERVSGCFKRI